MMKTHYGKTDVVVCQDALDLGRKAAAAVKRALLEVLKHEPEARMILAAGESQITFLDALAAESGIEWNRVVCFNMDDFYDPRLPEEFTCLGQLRRQLYDKVRPKRFEGVRWDAPDPEAEADRYSLLMREAGPFHILCQGIGTSGHLAFNEPGDTDFNDPALVRVVQVQETSRRQLRQDPNFRDLGYIPERGITMTIPAMMAAPYRFTIVPLGLKRPIVTRLFATPRLTHDLPATILRERVGILFLDQDSCPAALASS